MDFNKLSKKAIGAALKVHSALGPGHRKSTASFIPIPLRDHRVLRVKFSFEVAVRGELNMMNDRVAKAPPPGMDG